MSVVESRCRRCGRRLYSYAPRSREGLRLRFRGLAGCMGRERRRNADGRGKLNFLDIHYNSNRPGFYRFPWWPGSVRLRTFLGHHGGHGTWTLFGHHGSDRSTYSERSQTGADHGLRLGPGPVGTLVTFTLGGLVCHRDLGFRGPRGVRFSISVFY